MNPKYKVEYDLDKITNNTKMVELPHIFKNSEVTPKEITKDFKKLPREIKYTNSPKYKDIDAIRNKLRMNDFDHLHFEKSLKC